MNQVFMIFSPSKIEMTWVRSGRVVGDDEFGDAVVPEREPVVELGDTTWKGAFEPHGHHPAGVVGAVGADLLGRVLELGPGVPQERVGLLSPVEGLVLVDDRRVLGEE